MNDPKKHDRFGADAPPIGMSDNGTLNTVAEDAPPYRPVIVDDEQEPEDFADLED